MHVQPPTFIRQTEVSMTTPNKPPKGSNKKATSAGEQAAGYTVLARKYRPQNFTDLIGQDAMVRTLRNAFDTGRIAQAYMLTGVRGVGKTTTARILARALNYDVPGVEGPTTELGDEGEHCTAIMESRHQDVLEIDAASHTGVDNIREIIDSVRYRPAYARYKVYIIDEVHMLSKPAFNALLKTLEEPPEHVKFIFATTEIRKVPVTVLSRCQRFDLRRVDVELLQSHFAKIAELEKVKVDDEALRLIARAAEGSVRDGLSILDQAIAHGSGTVDGTHVRALLGLADRGRVFDLLETVLSGNAKGALEGLRALYDDGAEPVRILTDLSEAVHVITRIVAAGEDAADPTLSEAERTRACGLGEKLDMPALARAWQMLLKGLAEAQSAPRPLTAAEMLLVRMSYLSGAPTPEELARKIEDAPPREAARPVPADAGNGGSPTAVSSQTISAGPGGGVQAQAIEPEQEPLAPIEAEAGASPEKAAPSLPVSFSEAVALAEDQREIALATALRNSVRLVNYAPPNIEINLTEGANAALANQLRMFLNQATGTNWMVAVSESEGEQTLREKQRERDAAAEAERQAERDRLMDHPLVKAVLDRFPGAEITAVRPIEDKNQDDD